MTGLPETNPKNREPRIETLVDDLAYELGMTKKHGERIKALLTEFAMEIKRAAIEGEW